MIGNLPENPGYNGSILLIDDSEAAEIERDIDAAVEAVDALRAAANELLHQIDISDFTDSHGHSAKMLKAVHDLMLLLSRPNA